MIEEAYWTSSYKSSHLVPLLNSSSMNDSSCLSSSVTSMSANIKPSQPSWIQLRDQKMRRGKLVTKIVVVFGRESHRDVRLVDASNVAQLVEHVRGVFDGLDQVPFVLQERTKQPITDQRSLLNLQQQAAPSTKDIFMRLASCLTVILASCSCFSWLAFDTATFECDKLAAFVGGLKRPKWPLGLVKRQDGVTSQLTIAYYISDESLDWNLSKWSAHLMVSKWSVDLRPDIWNHINDLNSESPLSVIWEQRAGTFSLF